MYGSRGPNPRLVYLSPFEFTRYWEIRLLKYPKTIAENDEDEDDLQARLTEVGKSKLREAKNEKDVELITGEDYVVKEVDEETSCWLPFPECPATSTFRHEWVMVKNRRPVVPVFEGCPMLEYSGDTAERNARIVMAYFHPWVLDHAVSRDGVPHVTQLQSGD